MADDPIAPVAPEDGDGRLTPTQRRRRSQVSGFLAVLIGVVMAVLTTPMAVAGLVGAIRQPNTPWPILVGNVILSVEASLWAVLGAAVAVVGLRVVNQRRASSLMVVAGVGLALLAIGGLVNGTVTAPLAVGYSRDLAQHVDMSPALWFVHLGSCACWVPVPPILAVLGLLAARR